MITGVLEKMYSIYCHLFLRFDFSVVKNYSFAIVRKVEFRILFFLLIFRGNYSNFGMIKIRLKEYQEFVQ